MKKIDVKSYIDFNNNKIVDFPPMNYKEYRVLKACVNNAIIDYQKRDIKDQETQDILHTLDKLLLIICSNRIEKENIPLSKEYSECLGNVL
jgi:hypothetical protein